MSKMKKFASVLLALVMVFAMSVTAFAADDGYTITISNSTSGYTYVAYQIFAGDLSEDGETLSNITWGNGITEAGIAAVLAYYSTTDTPVTTAAEVAAQITAESDAAAFAELVANYLQNGTTSAYSTTNSNYTITVSDPGYYLVVNTVVPSGDYAYSDYIMKVVADVTVIPKSTSTPGFDKTVGTSNDGDLADTDDATEDYAIGDAVPFTLTATLPTSYSAYTTYKLVFTDTLSSGLTFNAGSLKVTVDGTTVLVKDTNYTLAVSEDGQTITITITDLKTSAPTAVAGSTVVVSYTATLNNAASSIENNTAKLSYSNNPNGTNMGETEEDKTYVVTFTVKVNKTTSDGTTPLPGAAFTLYKEVSVDESSFADGTYYTIADGVATKADEYDNDATYYVALETISTGTTFTFDGLDIGNYVLVETTTPDGYNTADPVYFTISASAVEDATEDDGVSVTITSPTTTDGFTVTAETLTTTVENYAGSELPSTGGIGTTIFYVVGGVLVAGAAVLLITRKRMDKAE